MKIRSQCVVPLFRHDRGGRALRHVVSPLREGASTRYFSASVLEVSHFLDGSPPSRFEHVAALPDKVRIVSYGLHSTPAVASRPELLSLVSNRVLTRPTSQRDRISRCATHPSKNPSSAQRARVTSGSEEPMFTSFAALLMLRVQRVADAASGFHRMRAHLQGFPPRGGPNPRLHIAVRDPKFSSSMGFWFPSETFVRLPLKPSQPVSASIPSLVSQRAMSVRRPAYPTANG